MSFIIRQSVCEFTHWWSVIRPSSQSVLWALGFAHQTARTDLSYASLTQLEWHLPFKCIFRMHICLLCCFNQDSHHCLTQSSCSWNQDCEKHRKHCHHIHGKFRDLGIVAAWRCFYSKLSHVAICFADAGMFRVNMVSVKMILMLLSEYDFYSSAYGSGLQWPLCLLLITGKLSTNFKRQQSNTRLKNVVVDATLMLKLQSWSTKWNKPAVMLSVIQNSSHYVLA